MECDLRKKNHENVWRPSQSSYDNEPKREWRENWHSESTNSTKRRQKQIYKTLYCQTNSEFLPTKTRIFLKQTRLWLENSQKSESPQTPDNQQLPFSLHFSKWWKLCFWAAKDRFWASHLWHMSASKATNERVKDHKWQPQRGTMTIPLHENRDEKEQKSLFFMFSVPEWKTKPAKICWNNS